MEAKQEETQLCIRAGAAIVLVDLLRITSMLLHLIANKMEGEK